MVRGDKGTNNVGVYCQPSVGASTRTEQIELTDRNNRRLCGAKMDNKRLMVDTRTPSLKMTLYVLLVRLPFFVEGRVKRKQATGSVLTAVAVKSALFMQGRRSSQVIFLSKATCCTFHARTVAARGSTWFQVCSSLQS